MAREKEEGLCRRHLWGDLLHCTQLFAAEPLNATIWTTRFNIPSKMFVIVTLLFFLNISLIKSSSHDHHIQVRSTAWLQGFGEKSKDSCLQYYLVFIMRHDRRIWPVSSWSLVIFSSISYDPILTFLSQSEQTQVLDVLPFSFGPLILIHAFSAILSPLEEWATLDTQLNLVVASCSSGLSLRSFVSVHTLSGHSHAFSRLLCGLYFSFSCLQLIPRKK